MGSKKPLPQNSLEICTEPTITKLINALYYFLDHVFIIIADEDYRLLVIHNNRLLWDKKYKSIRDARIAFSKRFGNMACDQLKKNIWSHRYDPDKDWLMDKLNLANNGN